MTEKEKERKPAKSGGGSVTDKSTQRPEPADARALDSADDEDADLRRADETDIADVADHQMPGRPAHVTIHEKDPLEEKRRRDFDRMVAESEKNRKKR